MSIEVTDLNIVNKTNPLSFERRSIRESQKVSIVSHIVGMLIYYHAVERLIVLLAIILVRR